MTVAGMSTCREYLSHPKELFKERDIDYFFVVCLRCQVFADRCKTGIWTERADLRLSEKIGMNWTEYLRPQAALSAVPMISLPGILSHKRNFTLSQLPSVLSAWQSKWSYHWPLNAQRNWNRSLIQFCCVVQLPGSKFVEAAA